MAAGPGRSRGAGRDLGRWLTQTLVDRTGEALATRRRPAHEVLDVSGRVDFRAERTLEGLVSRWVTLPGIGPWTANYIALRATGHPDAFPADDLVLQGGDSLVLSGTAEVLALAEERLLTGA